MAHTQSKHCNASNLRRPKVSNMTLLAIAIASSRRNASCFVKAFSTSALSSSLVGQNTNRNQLLNGARAPSLFIQNQKFSSTQIDSSTKSDADLDSALDEILGSAFKEAGDSSSSSPSSPTKKSAAPSVSNGEEQAKEKDFTDAKFLSTSNPYWTSVGMSQAVIDILSEKGITRFTEVQGKAFEPVLAGRDLIGRSRTGTGKTLAFGIPSIHRIVKLAEERGQVDQYGRRKRGRGVSMIVLCPTRELARQVEEELALVSKPFGLFITCFHGGVSYDPQARALRNGIDILVGTPGRIMDHIERGNLDLSECDVAILDEADEMLNMGFAEDVEFILKGVGSKNDEKTQCLLFSATTPPWVKEIGRNYQTDVVSVDATTDNQARTATTVRHMAIQVPPGPDSKKSILEDIIAVEISKDIKLGATAEPEEDLSDNPIAAAANAKKEQRK
jgi:ATP-dependent RNA helicase DDX21